MDKRFTNTTVATIDRRRFGSGMVAGGVLAATTFGYPMSPAFAQKDVGVDRLMAKTELPDITVGNKSAKVTIVEYASMTCPHCASFHEVVLPKLKEKYIDKGTVLLIMREFPLDQLALAVSMITRCAGDNDKTAALVDVFFKLQSKWRIPGNAEPKLLEIAKQAGFTSESFKKCFEDEQLYKNLIKQRDVASKEFGVSRTPSFFINGTAVKGNIMNIDTFAEIIDPLLKANG